VTLTRTTSFASAAAIVPRKRTLRGQVLGFIHSQGFAGATDYEIETALKMLGNTVRPRRRELEQMGIVLDSGKRRPTQTGRDAIVWITIDHR
jgi:hypothetical protein